MGEKTGTLSLGRRRKSSRYQQRSMSALQAALLRWEAPELGLSQPSTARGLLATGLPQSEESS